MARYGQAFKDKAVGRLLPPESASLELVARDLSISVATLEVRPCNTGGAQLPRAARAWRHDPQDNRYADRHPLHRIGLRAALQRPRLRPFCRTPRAEFGDELNRAVVEEGREIRGNVAASPIAILLLLLGFSLFIFVCLKDFFN